MLQLIGALLPTGLLAALLHWVAKRTGVRSPRLAIHSVSWAACSLLWMLGSADGRAAWNLDRFIEGLTIYFLPQLFWFVLETVKRGRVTAMQSPIIQPEGDPGPVGPNDVKPPSALLVWAGKHWWQVAMVMVAAYTAVVYSRHTSRMEDAQRLAASRAEVVQQAAQRERSEQQRREYVAKRRGDCYAIYDKERAKFNNVEGPEYDESADRCAIRYKHNGPSSTNTSCKLVASGDRAYWDTATAPFAIGLRVNCATNTFTNTF